MALFKTTRATCNFPKVCNGAYPDSERQNRVKRVIFVSLESAKLLKFWIHEISITKALGYVEANLSINWKSEKSRKTFSLYPPQLMKLSVATRIPLFMTAYFLSAISPEAGSVGEVLAKYNLFFTGER